MESLKQLLANEPPVIARTKGGELMHGYLAKGRHLQRGVLRIIDRKHQPVPVKLAELKAVFFVRTFSGNPDYLEEKTLQDEPGRNGLRVRLRFDDNEILEGVAENSLELLLHAGFFFWPSDPSSNNRLIYVVKTALIGFTILGQK